MPLFPCTCQFCDKRFLAPDFSNCCSRCGELYATFGAKDKVVEYLKRKGII